MASQYVYPGQSFLHTLVPLKGWYRESALDAAGSISSDVNINSVGSPAVSGLIVHGESITAVTDPYGGTMNGPGDFVFHMGCGAGDGIPMSLWSSQNEPDISNPGVIPGVPSSGNITYNADFFPVLPRILGQNLVALVHTGAYEVETTEYDTDQTYAPGNGLRTVTSDTDANAGKITNQRGATAPFGSAGATQYGDPSLAAWDTIVGIVSRGEYVNANRKGVVAYYTVFLPGTR